jgi:hypothetical protein
LHLRAAEIVVTVDALLGDQHKRRRAHVAAARDVHAHARRAHHARKVVAVFRGGIHAVVTVAHAGFDEAAFGDPRGHGRLQVLDIRAATAGFDIGHAVVGGVEQPVHVADMSGSGRRRVSMPSVRLRGLRLVGAHRGWRGFGVCVVASVLIGPAGRSQRFFASAGVDAFSWASYGLGFGAGSPRHPRSAILGIFASSA